MRWDVDGVELECPNWLSGTISELEERGFKRVNTPPRPVTIEGAK